MYKLCQYFHLCELGIQSTCLLFYGAAALSVDNVITVECLLWGFNLHTQLVIVMIVFVDTEEKTHTLKTSVQMLALALFYCPCFEPGLR